MLIRRFVIFVRQEGGRPFTTVPSPRATASPGNALNGWISLSAKMRTVIGTNLRVMSTGLPQLGEKKRENWRKKFRARSKLEKIEEILEKIGDASKRSSRLKKIEERNLRSFFLIKKKKSSGKRKKHRGKSQCSGTSWHPGIPKYSAKQRCAQ